jgi:hypothetical protein
VLPSSVFSTVVEELLSSEEARSPPGLFCCFLLRWIDIHFMY